MIAACLPDWPAELVARLAARLADMAANGVVERPPPHFAEEVTPPVGPVFDRFRPVLASADPQAWAEAVAAVGVGGLLLLLGQRRTPASLTGVDGLPPARAKLLASAAEPCNPGGVLTVAGRAWAKHAPRSDAAFWGTVSGGDRDKNAASMALIERILDGATWTNVFGHYLHGTVFEARLPSGHGARWGQGGAEFIGFLEPFTK